MGESTFLFQHLGFSKIGKKPWWTFFGKIPPMTGNFRGLRTVYISKESSEIDGCQSEDFHPNFWKIRKDTIRAIRYQKIQTFHRILPTFLGVFPWVHEILFGEVGVMTWETKLRRRLGVARAAICLSLLSHLNSARQFIATEVTPEGSWVRVFSYHCGCKFNTAHRTSESAYESDHRQVSRSLVRESYPKWSNCRGVAHYPRRKGLIQVEDL